MGSSPLARGLLLHRLALGRWRGIIPARAGFTLKREEKDALGGDHPRSRGVYSRSDPPSDLPQGSSPLARGLREVFGDLPPVNVDHPRSRGVYWAHSGMKTLRTGSSPLARGLPSAATPRSSSTRIIPARAGFTSLLFSFVLCLWDHPRSRGVYSAWRMRVGLPVGSSPLARGLRVQLIVNHDSHRIIPARAGFTCGRVLGG